MRDVSMFLAGYLLTVLAPGPNMIMIASKAIVDGRRATWPLIVGLTVGTMLLLAAMLALGAAVTSAVDLGAAGPSASGAALAFVAYAVAPTHRPRAKAATDEGAQVATQMGAFGFLVGVSTAGLNPVTASYFASQLLNLDAAARPRAIPSGLVAAGVAAVCLLRGVVVAHVFAAPRWRAAALRHESVVRVLLCACLSGYAAWAAAPACFKLAGGGADLPTRWAGALAVALFVLIALAARRATRDGAASSPSRAR